MYTKEDFWRDYPPKEQPFAFPWEEEYHKEVLAKAVEEAVRTAHEEERKAKARTMRELGMDYELITKVTGLTAAEIDAL